MKKVLFILLSVFFAATLSAQTDTQSTNDDAIFTTTKYDFGTIKQSAGLAVYEFKYINTGKEPLLISNARASCGCAVAEYSKEPVLPGKDFYIKVSYNPKNRPGAFNKNIYITTNYGTKTLTLKGVVE